MDNASVHKVKTLEPFLKKFNILYNAPYSPFLNPIEELFSIWKAKFRKQIFEQNISIVEKISSSYKALESIKICHCFYLSLSFLFDCLEKNPIK